VERESDRTLHDIVRAWAARQPDAPAFVALKETA
jgi:hypothetical protein